MIKDPYVMGGVEVKIAAIGDNVIDRYLNKDVMYPGGNAVNVAAHASMLGAQAAYIGEIGNGTGRANNHRCPFFAER